MKLHAVEMLFLMAHGGNRAARRRGGYLEAFWKHSDLVTVTHPDIQQRFAFVINTIFNAFKETALRFALHFGITEFAHV